MEQNMRYNLNHNDMIKLKRKGKNIEDIFFMSRYELERCLSRNITSFKTNIHTSTPIEESNINNVDVRYQEYFNELCNVFI